MSFPTCDHFHVGFAASIANFPLAYTFYFSNVKLALPKLPLQVPSMFTNRLHKRKFISRKSRLACLEECILPN